MFNPAPHPTRTPGVPAIPFSFPPLLNPEDFLSTGNPEDSLSGREEPSLQRELALQQEEHIKH